jgi:hypothetical protein
MIPARFVVEYPQRCLDLIEVLEPTARQRELVGSFSLLAAAAVFVIPYERMGNDKNPLHHKARDVDLFRALKALEKKPFIKAPFWNEHPPNNAWRFSRIMNNPNKTEMWKDEEGRHPMITEAKNSLQSRKASEVLRVIRNALAHGNIVYLNEKGFEQHDTKLQFLGFLGRCEAKEQCRCEAKEQQKESETYHLVTTTEETYHLVTTTEDEFLRFVKLWTKWVSKFRDDNRLEAA